MLGNAVQSFAFTIFLWHAALVDAIWLPAAGVDVAVVAPLMGDHSVLCIYVYVIYIF